MHASSDEKSSDSEDSFYEELQQVFFYNFSKYHMKMLSGDFNPKIQTSAKESLGLHELKQHKTWFDE